MSEEGGTCSSERQRWRAKTEIKVAGAEERKTGGKERKERWEGRRKENDER